jgi:hypothetical protein
MWSADLLLQLLFGGAQTRMKMLAIPGFSLL